MLLCTSWSISGGQNPIANSIYFIGNLSNSDGIIDQLLEEQLLNAQEHDHLVLLGDNIGHDGVPDSSHNEFGGHFNDFERVKKLKTLFRGKTIIIPGDGDWQSGKRLGWERVKNQQQLVDSVFRTRSVDFLPKSGCPGPEEILLSEQVALIIVDSQWILHPWEKPRGDSECSSKSIGDLIDQLKVSLDNNKHRRVILATHHPIISQGKYGTRSFGSLQYNSHPKTKAFSKILSQMLDEYDNVIHVSGHEHALQYLVSGNTPYVTCGALGEISAIKQAKPLQHYEPSQGFSKLIFHNNGDVNLEFWTVDNSNEPSFDKVILHKVYQKPLSIEEYVATNDFSNKIITTNASSQYYKESTWFGGDNYRDVWQQDRKFPVFDIGAEHGGLKIVQRGGGQQTRSLRLEDEEGNQYVLRSIEKYATKAIPEALRSTFAADIIQDQISASHPYGAFVIPYLADAADVYHTNPIAVYIPDDPRFGPYRNDFANTVCLYEERVAGENSKVESFGKADKLISTPKMLEKLYEDNDNLVDQQWVLKSRLFDMLIGDWDRHDDQWRWAKFDKGKQNIYRAVPRDRDQAFFVSEGFLMNAGSKKWGLPKFQGFDHEFDWVPGFNFNGRYFDRDFINEPSLEDWLAAADTLQMRMTDKVIEKAIRQWPEEIYQHRGEEIVSKLKSQRDNLKKYAREHYQFLSKAVNIEGSNKKEFFKVERISDDSTRVRMYKKTNKHKKEKKLYDRTFLTHETKEIRLYGLGGKDEYHISGETNKGLKIRVIGGTGKDEIEDVSSVKGISKKTWVYDKSDKNDLKLGKESKDKTSNREDVNLYDRKEFKYDLLAPIVFAAANEDDGIFLGGGFLYTNHGFRKAPYKSTHLFTGKMAFETNAFSFNYKGNFTDVIGKWDFGLNIIALAPNYITNYFGPGNESEYRQDAGDVFGLEDNIDYYRTRFRQFSVETFLTRDIGQKATLSLGHHWQSFKASTDYDGENRFVLDYALSEGDETFFEQEIYDGLMLGFEYDGRDNKMLTTHGLFANIDLRGYVGVDGGAKEFTRFMGEIAYFKSFRIPVRITFATRLGAGLNLGDYEFYQAQILNGNTDLRGYRKTRFFGDSKVFNNTELRAKLFNFNNRIIPMSVGINVFNDVGRVWLQGEDSDKWHHGYGAGLWLAPLNAVVLSVDLATSEEEDLIGYFRLGFRF